MVFILSAMTKHFEETTVDFMEPIQNRFGKTVFYMTYRGTTLIGEESFPGSVKNLGYFEHPTQVDSPRSVRAAEGIW
jgi:hypothetical protein